MTLTVTDVVEYAFCPKFTYFINILGLSQFERKRGTVYAGRKLHTSHEKNNLRYLPQGLKGEKITAYNYFSTKHDLSGKIDEAVVYDDEVILIERKYTDNHKLYPALRVQLGLLSMLIEENLHKPVRKAIVIFSKTKRKITHIPIDDSIRYESLKMLNDVKNTIKNEIMPESNFDNRCLNCTFRRICPTGSLNTDE